ncbi:MAG: two-component sensor histidine kinase [Isosphaera sp.]|nr:two-component sensor histidine kinase [Isosphaera sp.]
MHWVWLTIGVVCGGAVSAAAWAAVLRAYGARVRAAERRAQGAERMAEIGAMTGGLAHEIKNPLSTIGLNAQLLAEGLQESGIAGEERARLLHRVGTLRRETERLRGILTDFLEFAGQVRPALALVDCNALAGELADFFQPEAERRGVRLRLELSAGPLWAQLDAALIKQALLNLMLNAVQAMAGPASAGLGSGAPPAGGAARGELIVRSERAAGAAGAGETVRLHVIDTGPGLSGQVLAKLFTPYFTTKAGGSGLGLPVARRYVEAHGGRIEVYSEPGRGSDFTVTLPAAQGRAAQAV